MESPTACVDRAAVGLLAGSEPVLVAVSGGSDSVALLLAARHALGRRLRVVHVDHGLRSASAADGCWVAQLAASLGVPVRIESAAPGSHGGGRTETAARRRRLPALARAARDEGARWILLAHHADDDLETLLLQLRRGHRGDRILAGIPPVRALDADVSVVRPFLLGDAPPDRRALQAFRRAAGIGHRDDPSNRDTSVPRSGLRRRLAAGDLADLAGDAFRMEWLALRRRARGRLEARLLAATVDLHRGLQPIGLGCRLDRSAIPPLRPSTPTEPARPDEDLAERLSLLGACLARSRRVDPRGAVLRRLRQALAAGRGDVELPASPESLLITARQDGLHLPRETLGPGDSTSRILTAVARGSLYP